MRYNILVLNLGSTSTKVAIYNNLNSLAEETLRHPSSETVKPMPEQIEYRLKAILGFLTEQNFDPSTIDIVSARGGTLKPIEGGTYNINDQMVTDLLESRYGRHASNMSGLIADRFRNKYDCKAVITDPVVVDELVDEVRMTGLKGIERKSIFHALNQKAVARKYAESVHKDYEDINVIICHMGGGITAGAHRRGRVIDVNDGLSGEGPMSPNRTGSLPNGAFAKYVIDHQLDYDSAYELITKKGGFMSLAGTQDALELEKQALSGDGSAIAIYEAMAVQIAKEIAARAAILKGETEQIIFTGGLAYSEYLINLINPYISFIAPITVYPGEEEMSALAEGAYRVISGEESMKTYE
ncbi:butyrate kinase [Salinicoccus halodurans]|uniref:Probable butyrate kinase n=1 Tax=Salinicoccus halodurans TaxID=407035 RepID=A0A0F7HLV7_9STAP|nr:butyrate kinase [Salinicoccus halodurans]AKG74042.1 butyrate kinase [Salinicoccus halodurans]SFK59557.1 butyrate kinase [Salinicoccus halodurans]